MKEINLQHEERYLREAIELARANIPRNRQA